MDHFFKKKNSKFNVISNVGTNNSIFGKEQGKSHIKNYMILPPRFSLLRLPTSCPFIVAKVFTLSLSLTAFLAIDLSEEASSQ